MGYRGLSPPSHQFKSRSQEEGEKASDFDKFVAFSWFTGKQVTATTTIMSGSPEPVDRRTKTVLPISTIIHFKELWVACGKAQIDSELQAPPANMFKNSQSKQDFVWGGKEPGSFLAVFGQQQGYGLVNPDPLHYTSSLLWQCPINRAGISSSLEQGGSTVLR